MVTEISTLSIKNIKKMRQFINKRGRPTTELTDRIWQKIFYQLKENNIPYIDGEKKYMKANYTLKASINEFGEFEIDITSDYKRYCLFINQTLREIRNKNKGYCYYYYQICQLLKYHANLKSRYNAFDRYWEVWIDNE